MSERFDLLVVGGGPAGSTVAAMAAAYGVKTLLVERGQFPRDKVCGEFVSPEGCGVLERLGVLDDLVERGASWMSGCVISDAGGRFLDLPLPNLAQGGRDALGVSRELMDTTLLANAEARGAIVRQRCVARAAIVEGGRVRGMHLHRIGSAGTNEVRAAVVVAADGRRSLLARMLHPELGDPQRSAPGSWFGFKAHLDVDPDALSGNVALHLFRGGYAGLGAVEGKRINLCMMATVRALRACGGSADRLLAERVLSNPVAREQIGDARVLGSWKSIGPLRFGVRRPTASGAVFVGDAAGTIDPFCGEGMSNAMLAAETALPTLIEAVARGGLAEDLAVRYRDDWLAAFEPVTRRVRRLGFLFERPRLAASLLPMLETRVGKRALPRLVRSTRTGESRP